VRDKFSNKVAGKTHDEGKPSLSGDFRGKPSNRIGHRRTAKNMSTASALMALTRYERAMTGADVLIRPSNHPAL
jgi:hypothetical protein